MTHKDVVNTIKGAATSTGLTIPLSHKKFNANVSLTRGMGILLGGESGTGKTAIADSLFVLDIYDTWLHQTTKTFTPYWIYRSMERPTLFKKMKWICYKLWKEYQINCDVPTLLSWQNKMYTISDELIQLISTFDEYFEGLYEKVYIVQGADNPIGISKLIHNQMLPFGTIHQIDEYKKEFIYHDEKQIVFHVADHIGKIKLAKGYETKKQAIDGYSGFMSNTFRDFYLGTYIDISQLNRSIAGMDRLKLTDLDVKPEDFKDSAEPYENADLTIGMLNPLKRGLTIYPAENGYDMTKVLDANGKNRFRSMKIIKNSWGTDDLRLAYRFLGESGYMTELPKASEMDKIIEGTGMTWYDRLILKGYKVDSKWYK